MENIKIYVTHTPNRKSEMIKNDILQHIIAGAVYNNEDSELLKDNTGENISQKNKSYCELTTQYWAWKNIEADYYGFFHYRRYLSFSEKKYKENAWGMLEFSYLNDNVVKQLAMDSFHIRKRIEGTDFLIAKGIPTENLGGFTSVYEHYKAAPELHIDDLDTFMSIIDEDYPELSTAMHQYINGNIFYPCNMFIMKRNLFLKYSELLFNILSKFEKRADMTNYSREGYRTIGHLGERFLGIFYTYIKNRGVEVLDELQIALITNIEITAEVIPISARSIPIVLAANDYYVPILGVCLKSIIETASREEKYDITIFHTDITREHMKTLEKMVSYYCNIKLNFVNVGKYVHGYQLQAKQHITTETFYRFLILEIMKQYSKVIYLDCDLIVKRDLAELFNVDLGDCFIGAAMDPDFQGQCMKHESDMKEYCSKILKLKDPFQYFQAGVLLFNVEEMKKHIKIEKLFKMSDTGLYRFSDQDILNIVCENRVVKLDMRWNLLTDCEGYRWKSVIKYAPYYILDEYENARKDPYIIHYAGFLKPWMKTDEDMAYEFWRVARKTDFYEILLQRASLPQNNVIVASKINWDKAHPFLYKCVNLVLPFNSRRREFIKSIIKRK